MKDEHVDCSCYRTEHVAGLGGFRARALLRCFRVRRLPPCAVGGRAGQRRRGMVASETGCAAGSVAQVLCCGCAGGDSGSALPGVRAGDQQRAVGHEGRKDAGGFSNPAVGIRRARNSFFWAAQVTVERYLRAKAQDVCRSIFKMAAGAMPSHQLHSGERPDLLSDGRHIGGTSK